MDLSKIKNLVKQNGDKFIVVENDEPEIVVLSFKEYAKLTEGALIRPTEEHIAQEPNVRTPLISKDNLEIKINPALVREALHSKADSYKGYGTLWQDSEAFKGGVNDGAGDQFIETEFMAPSDLEKLEKPAYPIRLEDIRLEDLPI